MGGSLGHAKPRGCIAHKGMIFMFVAWPVIFGILAALFGVLGYTGEAQGWVLLAKVLFNVTVIAFVMALLVGPLVVKKIS